MERILHYVWKNRLIPREGLQTTDGLAVEVLSPGLHNKDAGPDFFSADILVDGVDWMGNVEIHSRSSDWYRHGHDRDQAYNNVVLHVVEQADGDIITEDGRRVPQMVISVPQYVVSNYEHLQAFEDYPPCYSFGAKAPHLITDQWLRRLCSERLERRAAEINKRLQYCEYNWERVFFISMARAFGFGVNGDAFEEWARTIPYSGAAKHRDNIFQIEALFLGQAGLLDASLHGDQQREAVTMDSYYKSLCNEYRFMANKFTLTPIGGYKWKFLRLRPQNFPTLRMAQFASLYCLQRLCLSAIIEAKDVSDLHGLLQTSVSPYWETHYTFCTPPTPRSTRQLQKPSLDILVLNGIIPMLYAYGQYRESKKLTEKALSWLGTIEAEDNKHTRLWRQMGLSVNNASESQAVIQLMTQYCSRKDCLRCHLGYQYIKKANNQPTENKPQ